MKVNFHQPLLGRDCKPILNPNMHVVNANLVAFLAEPRSIDELVAATKKLVPMTLADICYVALDTSPDKPEGVKKVKRWKLSCTIFGSSGPIEVEDDERVDLKTAIALVYDSPAIVGPAWNLLDTPSENGEAK